MKIYPWIILFFLTNLLVTQDGGTNARSRFASLRAITETHSFKINNYIDWTIDWSQTPDGNYYSNKAPGGMFLALPAFFLLDTITKSFDKNLDEKGRRPAPGYLHKTILSFLMQIIPFIVLILLWSKMIPLLPAQHFLAIAAFFGTTTSIMMNSYFGHGLAGTCLLAMSYFLYKENFFYVGLFYGLTLLTDYITGILILPLFITALLFSKNYYNTFKNILVGGIAPGILWICYHWICFGSPLTIAMQFQNPAFLAPGETPQTMGGALSAIPNFSILWELLFGTSRGILFTQPWIYLVSFCFLRLVPKSEYRIRSIGTFSLLGLLALLWIVASYKDWQGGFIAGPRYLSIIFPLFAVLAALLYEKMLRIEKIILWASLAFSVVLRALIYGDTILAPPENLWVFYWNALTGERHTALLRTSIFVILFLLASYFAFIKKPKFRT